MFVLNKGGASVVSAAVGISATSGVSVAIVLAVIFVGSALLLAIWKDYEEIEFSIDVNGVAHLKLKRTASTPPTKVAEVAKEIQPQEQKAADNSAPKKPEQKP